MIPETTTNSDYPLDQDSSSKQAISKSLAKHVYTQNKASQPKRNKSAFLIFSTEMRIKLKSEGLDGLNANEMVIKLADLWRNLPQEDKKVYYEKASQDKVRYYQELEAFWKDNPRTTLTNRTKNNYVKKPSTAYGLYLIDVKEELKRQNPHMRMADIMKVISSQWKGLDQAKRAIYQERAKQEKEQVRKKLEEQSSKSKGTEIDLYQKRVQKQHLIRKQIIHSSIRKSQQKVPSKFEQTPTEFNPRPVYKLSGSWPDLDLLNEFPTFSSDAEDKDIRIDDCSEKVGQSPILQETILSEKEMVVDGKPQAGQDTINSDFVSDVIDFNNIPSLFNGTPVRENLSSFNADIDTQILHDKDNL